mgnify:FL=1
MIERKIKFNDHEDSIFLWGARQTGKSTLLMQRFPEAKYYDLLESDLYERFRRQPSLLRNELSMIDSKTLIIIDEIQKIPELLDEVHWLMSRRNMRFILSGSSSRKLRKCGANLLGGRAIRQQLFPFVSAEIPDFNLSRAINNGMLPRHYLIENPAKRLQAYVGDYLREEIKEEALTRNIASFSRFLETAAINDGEILNYNNIATDCGVSAPTVKEYFSILEETLIGYTLPAYTKTVKRRMIQASKFYIFDIGVVNYLTHRKNLQPGSVDYGHALEHLIVQEIMAYLSYTESELQVAYWRTASGFEVDIVISEPYSNEIKCAIEVKSCQEVQNRHLKGLRALHEEHPQSRLVCISHDMAPRMTEDGIEIWPVEDFLKQQWNGKFF